MAKRFKMKKLLLIVFIASSVFAFPKEPTNSQLVAEGLKPISVMGLCVGVAGLAYSGFLHYHSLHAPCIKDRYVLEQFRNFVLKIALPTTIASGGLFAFSKKLENC